jgi:5-hydroxyisourate hydrolase-like protein (transthyretin family)
VVKQTKKIYRGNTASVTIQGEPGVKYSISVYYSTTVSTAKGLTAKTADKDGIVKWSWKVGTRTKPGTYKIVISGNQEKLTLKFKVMKK